ncbi:MAG: lytic transglycosylase domain-containing protein [Alphaproteobacteria bacterium]|nr:lytic transglycosylase domain-containing protein [Alphaproteobacteria bacterium]
MGSLRVQRICADHSRPRRGRQAWLGIAALVLAVMAVRLWGQATAAEVDFDPTLTADQRARFVSALQAAKSAKWETARQGARTLPAPAAKFVDWYFFAHAGNGFDFEEVTQFVRDNPDWPRQNALRRAAEVAQVPPAMVPALLAWLAANPPVSVGGRIRLADLKFATGAADEAKALIRQIWINDDLSPDTERAFYANHKKRLTSADHALRLDRLLWDGKLEAARNLLQRVDADQRSLATARLALMQTAGNVESLIAKVPVHLQNHPGLLYERARWRRLKNKQDGARELLLQTPGDLVRPDKWWNERRYQARRLLHKGHISDAYQLARDHGQTSALGVAEAEWLAGWIALTFLKEYDAASQHFVRAFEAVRQPVSLARMAYWAGRAAEAAQSDEAAKWYAEAARHNMTYYGQLALTRTDGNAQLSLPADPQPSPEQVDRFRQRELVWVARALADVGETELLRTFVLRINEIAADAGERYLLASMVHGFGRPDLAVAAAKRAHRFHGVFLTRPAYPVIDFPRSVDVEPAFLHAVTRQESEFDARAISSAGARGLMQLMPNTARLVAKSVGLKYDRDSLIEDPRYNVTLGSHHLADLVRIYRGSYVLALAAYNAGPGRVEDWIREWGDPRSRQIDVIDWIELIPLRETRDYIQRVLENLQVYRHRLNGGAVPLRLLHDLNGQS